VIRAEREGGVALVWLDRPEKRNALTLGMIEAIGEELYQASSEEEVQGVIIAGKGPSTCAGVDLNEFASATPASIRALITALAETCAAARECEVPVLMAIYGHCLGGGLELACACDFRVAATGAQLGMPEVAVGIPSVIDAALLERLVGLGRAHEMILTGDPVSAEQALAWGLVNRVVAGEALMAASAELLGRVTRWDPDAISRQKEQFRDWLNLPYDDAVSRSRDALAGSFEHGVPQGLARQRLLAE
jgi:enoyl-CoA hydratase